MTPEQLAFVYEKLSMDDERLVPHVYNGPWWRRLIDRLRAIADPFVAFDKELFKAPRGCNTCDSEEPMLVSGFTEVRVYDCTTRGASPTRTAMILILVCEDCGTQQAVDPVTLGVLDANGKWLISPPSPFYAALGLESYSKYGFITEGMHNVLIGEDAGKDGGNQ